MTTNGRIGMHVATFLGSHLPGNGRASISGFLTQDNGKVKVLVYRRKNQNSIQLFLYSDRPKHQIITISQLV